MYSVSGNLASNKLVNAGAASGDLSHLGVRRQPGTTAIKINLYNGLEAGAVLEAIAAMRAGDAVECFMVGDSYLMTHLGYPSTRLDTKEQQDWFLNVMISLVGEVARALAPLHGTRRPFLLADLPDGAAVTTAKCLAAAERMVAAGAEAIKLEIVSPESLGMLEALARRGYTVLAHIGYTPQDGANRRHGDSVGEALELFGQARAARDHGACGLTLERVSEPVNRTLCQVRPGALPIYSIFSGRAAGGGQSLNVWDAVFLPDVARRYFPPTATLPRSAYPEGYTAPVIQDHMTRLLAATLRGEFPLSPPTRLAAQDIELLLDIDPWQSVR
jgi:ketopantoate hydroxymethyltransferase